MSHRLLFSALILLLAGNVIQADETKLERPSVNPEIKSSVQIIPDKQGRPQNVAATRSEAGVQSEFVEGVILVRPKSEAELQRFLESYGGTVLGDNSIPVPPPEFGVTLSEEQRKPTIFTVRIDLNRINPSSLAPTAVSSDHARRREFSSEPGLLTFLAAREARTAGFRVSLNYVAKRNQAFPSVMFNSQERPTPPPGAFTDAFAEPRYGATGSQTNVTLAWQFVAAHGIQRRVRVAILDSGFWLTPTGFPRGADNDLAPPPVRPLQFDIDQNDVTADGPNSSPCTATNPCFWHGTGAAAVAVGIMNNSLGHAGTGSLVGDPVLIKLQNLTRENEATAVRMAILFGADVISMSWSSECDSVECREDHRDIDPFADAGSSGSLVVFVAAAGNSSKSVDSPFFVHPCIERYVICVGALNDNATTISGSSNFGGGVDIFAPTNIPVMSFPPSADLAGNPLPLSQAFGAEGPRSFGGTSASTPFIAGVTAMMKAINPGLNSNDVSRILTATASPGVVPATRIVNALAAVRGAAEGLAMIKDRLEPNDLETQPTILSTLPPHTVNGLNLDHRDRDYFQFNSPSSSTATITLTFPEALSSISVHSFEALGTRCPAPMLLSDTAIAGGRGHTLLYRVPGGPLRLGLRATGTNAYNLGISFAQMMPNPDAYEANNLPSEARYLYSLQFGQSPVGALSFDPRFRIEATIHSVADVDYYIVQGASMTMAEQVLLSGHSAIRIYGNDSPIRLEVYNLNPDNTQGTLVADIGGGSCAAEPLSVRIEPGLYYLVKVSGTPGNYVLSNGVGGEKRRIPPLMRDRVYEVLNPGEPVIHAGNYVFSADSRFRAVRANDPGTLMRLFDAENNVIAESVSNPGGASLSLARMQPGHVYGLYISTDGERGTRAVQLSWQPTWPVRVSSNVLLAAHQVATGSALRGEDSPVVASLDGPNMSDRQQTFALGSEWRHAIDAGRVEGSFSAFVRASSGREAVSVRLTFLADDQRELGTLSLPMITLKETQGERGLLPVRLHDRVPERAAYVRVHVRSADKDGGPDTEPVNNLELILTEFPP